MADEKKKHSGKEMDQEELEDYNKTWKDIEDCFNNLEVIDEEDEE